MSDVSNELAAGELRLLGSYADGPRIWDAAVLLPVVVRLENLGLITPVSAGGAAMKLTERGRAALSEGTS